MSEEIDPALLRALVQDLAGFRRSGVSWIPRVEIPSPSAAAPAQAPALNRPVAPSKPASPPTRPAQPARGAHFDEPRPTRAAVAAPSPAQEPLVVIPPQPIALDERRQLLDAFCRRVAKCTRCDELARTRTQTVFGVGNPQAQLVFIGEAPGADEDKQGEPFVGKAGQLLNRIIEASKLKREEVYICNVLKCRPPGNRTPSPGEGENCWEYLAAQLAIIDPDYIVCWGSVAAQRLLSTTTSIGKLRGRFLSYGRAKVLCTYHPSYLLRNPAAKKDVWEDMKFLRRDMGVEL